MTDPDHISTSAGESRESPPPDASRRASNFAAVAILLLIFLTPAFGFWWLREMAREVVERNALSHTRDMLVHYMARTHGEWPSSWDDLKPDFKPVDIGYGTHSVKELERIVAIDFDLDLESVDADLEDSDKPPRIIWLKNRGDTDDVRKINVRMVEIIDSRLR